jgi:hypothetical protein
MQPYKIVRFFNLLILPPFSGSSEKPITHYFLSQTCIAGKQVLKKLSLPLFFLLIFAEFRVVAFNYHAQQR